MTALSPRSSPTQGRQGRSLWSPGENGSPRLSSALSTKAIYQPKFWHSPACAGGVLKWGFSPDPTTTVKQNAAGCMGNNSLGIPFWVGTTVVSLMAKNRERERQKD